jgi:hypothetical protein
MEICDEILLFRSWYNEMLNVINKTMCLEVCSKQYEPIHSNIPTLFATHRMPKDTEILQVYVQNFVLIT